MLYMKALDCACRIALDLFGDGRAVQNGGPLLSFFCLQAAFWHHINRRLKLYNLASYEICCAILKSIL
jgi:hypothetical protein